jgi:hypothetical protein
MTAGYTTPSLLQVCDNGIGRVNLAEPGKDLPHDEVVRFAVDVGDARRRLPRAS